MIELCRAHGRCRLPIAALCNDIDDAFQPPLIHFIEPVFFHAVNVEQTDNDRCVSARWCRPVLDSACPVLVAPACDGLLVSCRQPRKGHDEGDDDFGFRQRVACDVARCQRTAQGNVSRLRWMVFFALPSSPTHGSHPCVARAQSAAASAHSRPRRRPCPRCLGLPDRRASHETDPEQSSARTNPLDAAIPVWDREKGR